MYPYVHCSTIHNGQGVETTQVPINQWLDKDDVVYIYNGILLSHKKDKNHPLCNHVDGPWGHHAKWNEPDRERHGMWIPTFV